MGEYDLLIDFGNGEQKLSELLPKVNLLSFSPPAPIIERDVQSIPGKSGLIQTNQKKVVYKERPIPVKLLIKSVIPQQFYLWRSEVYRLLVRDHSYYISNTFEPYKRWLVTCDGNFSIEKEAQYRHKEFQVEFTCLPGVAESKYNTDSAYNLSKERFGIGMNIPNEDLVYLFEDSNAQLPYQFRVYNGGDIRLYTTEHDFEVELTLTGKDVKISNRNTGEYLMINETLTKAQVVIFRQYVTVNGKIAKTTGRFPSLLPGYNLMEVSGASQKSIKFNTRFYYK
ncbi:MULTISPECIES: phage tail domain-containing protein [unclassified Bacillus (in: firmicutes)]|uniref:phage tail domain-containing protein n=1 Tax=unclassified Bacillus (in: firmicutes) TaxID=185979 RepID=UPI001BEBA77F|nr:MULTISPECIES: phage tail domain-containing protein [unclassified Bacillus (in: firmicutes)]MBT2615334.1 phage tail family protein [Bacillus sp. ISL-78]MBT2628052.1 phage tail family protein [Bacillus sp. ISL-101]